MGFKVITFPAWRIGVVRQLNNSACLTKCCDPLAKRFTFLLEACTVAHLCRNTKLIAELPRDFFKASQQKKKQHTANSGVSRFLCKRVCGALGDAIVSFPLNKLSITNRGYVNGQTTPES